MAANLFVYGTLMNADVWNLFASKEYDSYPYTLRGFKKIELFERPYPGIIRSSFAVVEGLVYVNVSMRDLRKLDEYEGEEYARIEVFQDGTKYQTYLYIADNQR